MGIFTSGADVVVGITGPAREIQLKMQTIEDKLRNVFTQS